MNKNTVLAISVLFLVVQFGSCVLNMGRLDMEMETEMDSEINKRVLWMTEKKKYISYEALKNNVVPCSRPGAPYYNCHGVPRANPYTRGCGIITRCARDANP